MFPHNTQPSCDFKTTLHFSNNSDRAVVLTLTPFLPDGTAVSDRQLNLAAMQTVLVDADDYFGTSGVSHIRYEDRGAVRVTAGYRGRNGNSIVAHATPPSHATVHFSLPQADLDRAFDSLAIVNAGSLPTAITITHRDAHGSQIGQVTAAPALASLARLLVLLNGLFPEVSDSYYDVDASQPMCYLSLGGTLNGAASPAFFQGLTQTHPLTGDGVWIPHLTPLDSTFSSQIVFTNPTSNRLQVALHPYTANGSALAALQLEVLPLSTRYVQASALASASHVRVVGGAGASIRVSYSRRDGQGIASFLEPPRPVRSARFLQGNTAATWDGFALTNPNPVATAYTIEYFNLEGASAGRVQGSLTPFQKTLFLPANAFTLGAGGTFQISAIEPLVLLALRGNQNSSVLFGNLASADFVTRTNAVTVHNYAQAQISISGDRVTVTPSGRSQLPEVGSIITGNEQHPFIRKVMASRVDRGGYVLDTTTVPITEVIKEGIWIASSPTLGSTEKLRAEPWQADFNGGASLQASAGGTIAVSITPSMEMFIAGGQVEYVTMALEGEIALLFNAHLAGQIQGEARFTKNGLVNRVLGTTVHLFSFLPVFVVWELQVDGAVEFTGNVTADLDWSASARYTASTGATFAFVPEFGVDGFYRVPSPRLQPLTQTVQISAELSASLHLIPKIHARLAGILGPYVALDAYSQATFNPLDSTYELGLGLKGDVGGELNPLFFGEGHAVEANLFDLYWPLYQGSFAGAGTIQGVVRNAATNVPLSGVTVTVLDGATTVETAITDSAGQFAISLQAGTYTARFAKSGFIGEVYNDVVVTESEITYLEPVLQIDVAQAGIGTAAGQIINALDGSPVAGLLLQARAGINATSGPVVATPTTDANGRYTIGGLQAGNYTVAVSASGYQPSSFRIIVLGGLTIGNQNSTVTPLVAEGETRIILTWGEQPYDLDSYLSGPSGDTRFVIYFADRYYEDEVTRANLDRDDVTSYGPETVTIERQGPGVYRYLVHNYSDRGSSTSSRLSNSGAQVRVVRGNNQVALFNVPSNQPGTVWTVFDLQGNTITPINTIGFNAELKNSGIPDEFTLPDERHQKQP